MKNIKKLSAILALGVVSITVSAQEVTVNDTLYVVKKELIFKDGVEVTNTLSEGKKAEIFKQNNQNLREIEIKKQLEKAEKERIKAEKERKQAEKKQRRAERELRKRDKAQDNYDKAVKKHKDAIEKYEKLKKKGKLAPVEETEWLEKIEKLRDDISKTKKKLK